MQYSPKLKKAMEEIKTILKENDIAGFVILHTPGFSEYINYVSPSYSCAKIEGSELRFKLKAVEVGGKESAHKIASDTFNMVTHFSDILGMSAMNFAEAKRLLKERLGGEEFYGDHTSHNQQNN